MIIVNQNKRPPKKVVWYFPIIPCLKRLFENEKSRADEVVCQKCVNDGKLRHLAVGSQWRAIDSRYKTFKREIRNIRFGLSTDGMSPFNMVSTNHSTWPVTLHIYNLPPWLCMKRTYIMMSLVIQGPHQPGNNIDVYLQPVVDELIEMWTSKVKVWDEYKKEHFYLKALLFVTISDLLGLGCLSGQVTKGYKGCVVCMEDMDAKWVKNSKKMVYMGHRRFLSMEHLYRMNKKSFYGKTEDCLAPRTLTAKDILTKVNKLKVILERAKEANRHRVSLC
jgi:hypothetical protein